MIEPLRIPAGSELFIGAPAKPLAPAIVEGLRSLMVGMTEIEEAHRPQVYVPAVMTDAAQVLIVVAAPSHHATALEKLGRALPSILSTGMKLDVWPMATDHEMLATVRAAGCEVKPRSLKRFWRWWNADG